MKNQAFQSIYELADRVGVSASTVSRVLNGRDGIGDATRQRVLSAARAAGFRPRMTARSMTVALVIDRNQFISFGGFVSSLMSHIVHVLSRHDLAVELITEHSFARLRDRLVDGVLALAWDDATIDELRNLPDVPVVTINRMDTPDFSAVATDHARQGEMAVDYLASRGHRRIAMVCEERNNWGALERIKGFTAAMERNHLPMIADCIAFTDHQPMYGVMRRLLGGYNPTAVFVAGEDLGLEASYILRDVLGLQIPRDMSLLGMESAKVSQFLAPPMTTLCQPLEDLAERALAVLLEQMDGKKSTRQSVIIENTLIERESVATIATT